MKTMKTVAALALATGNVHAEAFAQAFENSMAAQAKIDYEVEQDLRQKYSLPNGKGMVLVSSHYISVSAAYGCSWQGMDHDLNAKRIAIWGLLANPSSECFNVTIRDSTGEGRAFIQRPADKGTLLDRALAASTRPQARFDPLRPNNAHRQPLLAYTTINREENLSQMRCIARHADISNRESLISRRNFAAWDSFDRIAS